MAKAIVVVGGSGGGSSSDDCTATVNDLMEGVTAITSDSDGEPAEGTIVERGNEEITDLVYMSETSRIHTYLEPGAYRTPVESHSGRHLVHILFSTLANVIGLTAAKIATGSTILGVTGTYKGLGDATAANVLSGKKFSTASLSNAAGTMANVGSVDSAKSITLSGGTLYARMTNGAHVTNASSGYPEVSIAQATLASTIGLVASSLWAGISLLGISSSHESMAGKTVTPSTASQTISCSGKVMTSNVTVTGDSNLVASNIKKGVNIFGVTGTFSGYVPEANYPYKPGLDSGNWANRYGTIEKKSDQLYCSGASSSLEPRPYTQNTYNFGNYTKVNVDVGVEEASELTGGNYSIRSIFAYTADSNGDLTTNNVSSGKLGETTTSISTNGTKRATVSIDLEGCTGSRRLGLAFAGPASAGPLRLSIYKVWFT